MYALLFVAICAWFMAVFTNLAAVNIELFQTYREQRQRVDFSVVAGALQQYYAERNAYPTTLAALETTAGFEYTRGYVNGWQGMLLSGSINDGVWQFIRAGFYSYNPTTGPTASAYAAINSCGSGGFTSPTGWCGSPVSLWYKRDTKEFYAAQTSAQRGREQRTLQKFAGYFSANQAFPAVDQNNQPLVAGNSYPLPALAGYAGGSTNCTGIFQWQGIPIECGEMFDIWGNPLTIAYLSTTHIALASASPIYNAVGQQVSIAADLNAT